MSPPNTPRVPLLLAVLGLLPTLLAAQGGDPLSRGFDLERRGSYAQAAEVYRGVLQIRPGDVSALLGLERSLTPLNRVAEILPAVRAGIAANPSAVAIYALGVRAYSGADRLDSLPRLIEQWARIVPGDETPYREWGAAALTRRDRVTARRAYQLGRDRLGKPEVLAAEMAQLAIADEDWPAAVREWARAVRALPGYRATAATALGQAPEGARPEILRQFERDSGLEASRIAVDLRARWGDPLGAFGLLQRVLAGPPGQQLDALQAFLEQARTETGPAYLRAQGLALEQIAERWTNAPQRARYRLEAARAFAAAGDRPAARRMLDAVAGDGQAAPQVVAGATATLIGLLVDEGQIAEASLRLEQYRASLPVEEYQRLRREVAGRLATAGELARAEAMLANDSTVEAMALLGRFRLYAGDLKGATELLKQAGPFAGNRAESTDRSILLALLQPIEPDTLLPLGEAFRRLDGGDTSGAATALERLAAGMPADRGGAELLLFAGRLAAGRSPADAERLFRLAMHPEAPAAAAAAALELGRLQLATGKPDEARHTLEGMILAYPGSPLVPQARRLLDQARNAVPRT